MVLNASFNNISVTPWRAVCIGGGNWNTRRKPPISKEFVLQLKLYYIKDEFCRWCTHEYTVLLLICNKLSFLMPNKHPSLHLQQLILKHLPLIDWCLTPTLAVFLYRGIYYLIISLIWKVNSTNGQTIPPISTKPIMTSHLLNTEDHNIWNTGPLLGQGQTYGGFKPVNGIKILTLENFSNGYLDINKP